MTESDANISCAYMSIPSAISSCTTLAGYRSHIPVWQPIIAQYDPTLIGECEKAIALSDEVVTEWLISGMFRNDQHAKSKANKIVKELGSHATTKSHARHIFMKRAKQFGLIVEGLEDDNTLQDTVLSVHHACMHSLTETAACKIVENHKGAAHVLTVTAQP